MTSTAPTRPARNRQVSSRIASDDNSVGLSAAAQNLLSAKPIIDLVKKIAKLTLFLPETVPLATEEDDIPRRIFELEGEYGTVASTFNRRVDILFGEHVRDSDGRLTYVRRGNLGMDCVVKYLESIHWESAKISLDRTVRTRRLTESVTAGLKELLSDEPSAPKTRAAVVIGVVSEEMDVRRRRRAACHSDHIITLPQAAALPAFSDTVRHPMPGPSRLRLRRKYSDKYREVQTPSIRVFP
ncbi:hypothetical protein DFH09DRAFT_1271440 [Mycena vulgaris]|nr:hypothetical protein DFH09DRAFT_1271440 [Mycena vulgaris]